MITTISMKRSFIKKNTLAVVKPFLLLLFLSLVFINTNCTREKIKANIKFISVDRAYEIINSDKVQNYLVVDVRGRMDYIRGHLVPAVWIPYDSLPDKLEFLPKEKSFIIYDSTNAGGEKAAGLLLQSGFKKVAVLQGGHKKWLGKSYPLAIQLVRNTSPSFKITRNVITPLEVQEIIRYKNQDYVIIDIRPNLAFEEGHIEGAISIPYLPLNEFVVKMEEKNFPKNRPIILYGSGSSTDNSERADEVLQRNDFTETFILKGGMKAWLAKPYPTPIK